MYRKSLALILVLAFLLPSLVFAGGDVDKCTTKNPVILAHGMFANDDMLGFIDYWWGIEDALEDEGCEVYVTSINAMDSSEAKAEAWKQQVLEIEILSGKHKFNVIGHSHGGIYSRYAISNLGLDNKIASHTSYCSPHRGSATADVIMGIVPDPLEDFIGWMVNTFIAGFVFGDSDPDSLANGYGVTREYMNNVFNPNSPDMPGIYYQSYATKIKTITADMVLEPSWILLKFYEGANDGLVSVDSAKWGTFRGVESGAWWAGGVSHINAIGHFFGITPGFDAGEHFVDIVSDLKDMGY